MTLQTEPHNPQPIHENLWWVIPGQLAGVRQPTLEEISELKASGIGAIVSVMDDPSNLDIYQQAQLPHLWVPITGGTAPSLEQVQQLQGFIQTQVAAGKGVAIHCSTGRRRTGTAIAAVLIHVGESYETAVQKVLAANPQVELRDAQIAFLKGLAQQEEFRNRAAHILKAFNLEDYLKCKEFKSF
ncbi:MAG: protein phosphatase [Oscillatoriales cyanobacterium RM2_1_1]|nr:protein phosphatase [Oscillatoriales cyanobacterium SM2_3_0]NJO44176.1 protein phosphatase [Oscillatoriales cyanobacterium RM2_1_1]